MSCQHRHSRNFRTSIPLFSIDSQLRLSDPRSPFSRPSRTRPRECHRGPSPVASFQFIHNSSDDGNCRSRLLGFDARGEYRLGCEYLVYLSPTLNSFNLQLAAEASILSCICVIIVFVWIGVRPAFIHVSIIFDEMLHSVTYVGIRGHSQTVIGSCFRGLLTSTWSARQFFCCHLLGSLNFHDSSHFSYSNFCKQLAVSS